MFVGAAGAGVVTGADGRLFAVAEPAELEAVTAARRVPPASAETAVYEEPVAPEMFEQKEPDPSHRCH